MAHEPDAVVIGGGPNGLVAANVLADAGWHVEVLEAQPEPGGAVRSGELTLPGFVHDRFSSFYPLGIASPAMQAMNLEAHGVRWRFPELPVAHPASDGPVAYVAGDTAATAASLEAFGPGDGEAWRRLYTLWERLGDAMLQALFDSIVRTRERRLLMTVSERDRVARAPGAGPAGHTPTPPPRAVDVRLARRPPARAPARQAGARPPPRPPRGSPRPPRSAAARGSSGTPRRRRSPG
jgi:phytoene dehydrogenase-like protein